MKDKKVFSRIGFLLTTKVSMVEVVQVFLKGKSGFNWTRQKSGLSSNYRFGEDGRSRDQPEAGARQRDNGGWRQSQDGGETTALPRPTHPQVILLTTK